MCQGRLGSAQSRPGGEGLGAPSPSGTRSAECRRVASPSPLLSALRLAAFVPGSSIKQTHRLRVSEERTVLTGHLIPPLLPVPLTAQAGLGRASRPRPPHSWDDEPRGHGASGRQGQLSCPGRLSRSRLEPDTAGRKGVPRPPPPRAPWGDTAPTRARKPGPRPPREPAATRHWPHVTAGVSRAPWPRLADTAGREELSRRAHGMPGRALHRPETPRGPGRAPGAAAGRVGRSPCSQRQPDLCSRSADHRGHGGPAPRRPGARKGQTGWGGCVARCAVSARLGALAHRPGALVCSVCV